MAGSRRSTDVSKAAKSLRKIAALTVGSPDDSPADAKAPDRLELAAEVLDVAARTEEEP
ncbi:MAG: hypothetical protein ABSC00_08050 [Acidimicrobiales bacterium]